MGEIELCARFCDSNPRLYISTSFNYFWIL